MQGLSCTFRTLDEATRSNMIKITWDTGVRHGIALTLLEIVSSKFQISTKEQDDVMDYPRGLVLARTEDGSYRRLGLCYYDGGAEAMRGLDDDVTWEMTVMTLV